jgi:REP element-mobilizing transposase RayT
MPSSPTNPHPEPGRRGPVHWPTRERDNLSIVVFVTVCTQDRKRFLAREDAVAVLRAAWVEADAWVVGRYVVMPDHLHLFCSPVREEFSVKQWVAFWKSRASTRWPRPAEQPVWQRDCWDVQMRRGESYPGN